MKLINVKVIGADVPMEVYRRRDPAVRRGHPDYIMSRGELVDFARCPKKWLLGEEEEDTKATDWGSLVDCLVLTPDRFESEYITEPLTYKTTGMECPSCGSITDSKKCRECKCDRHEIELEKDWSNNSTTCQEWAKKQAKLGLKVIKPAVLEEAQKAVKMIHSDHRIMEMINCSQRQVMIVMEYVDELTGIHVPLKVLIDLLPNPDHPRYGKSAGDFKTARCADFHAWDTAVGEHGYDVQLALYMAAIRAAYPDRDLTDWRWPIQENTPPYITARRIASEEQKEIGMRRLLSALNDYCICLATGEWPAYDDYGDSYDGWKMSEPKEWMVSQMYGMGLKLPPKQDSQMPGEDHGIIP